MSGPNWDEGEMTTWRPADGSRIDGERWFACDDEWAAASELDKQIKVFREKWVRVEQVEFTYYPAIYVAPVEGEEARHARGHDLNKPAGW